MEAPSPHAIGAMVLAMTTFWLFAQGKIRTEVVSLLLIAALALLLYFFPIEREGANVGLEIAFSGFGHPALIAICCLMIMGRGLVVTGALEPAARLLTQLWKRSRLLGLLVTLIAAACMSMVVNDTPVLVLLLPLLLNLAARIDLSPAQTLMPVNCAILIGGMSTTIGTSTNLLVVSIAEDMGLPRFEVFDFTGMALTAGLVALPYLWLVMPRLLPNHLAEGAVRQRLFQASLHITDSTPLDLLRSDSLRTSLSERGLRLLSIVGQRGEIAEGRPIALGDILRVEATLGHLRDASEALKASLALPSVLEQLRTTAWRPTDDLIVAELVIGADSALIDQTVRSAQIADRYGVAVIGYCRPETTGAHSDILVRDERMGIGDVLLVQGPQDALKGLQLGEGAMVLEGAAEMPRSAKAPIALAVFAAAVAGAAFHLVPIAISSLAGAIAMLASGCVKFDRLGRALSGEVIVLVAASIALGQALLETGAAHWMGAGLALGLQDLPPAGILAAVMAFAALLTNFSSNTAAAAVGTPVAVTMALQLGVPGEPMVLAVLFGCNLCFATPIAYQTNILIMSAGGYQFRDYVRAGLPLVILMIVTLSALLVWRYGL